jgi:cell division protease FtsH
MREDTATNFDNRIFKNGILTLLLVLMGVALLYAYRAQSPSAAIATYDKVVSEIQAGQVSKVTINTDTATIEKIDKTTETVNIGANDTGTFQKIVLDYNTTQPAGGKVQLTIQKDSATFGIIGSVLLSLLPVLLIGGFFVYMMRQAQGTNNQALSFGKSRARMFIGNKPTVTFDDVAGVDEAKQELTEVVEFL